MKTRYVLSILLCIVALVITFEWDYNQDHLIDGFQLYQTQISGQYTSPPVATVPAGVHIVTITIADGIYYWVATAYKGQLESKFSNEVTNSQPSKPTGIQLIP